MNRVLLTVGDRDRFVTLLVGMKLPVTVSVENGKKRSIEQNRLQRMWMLEAAEQLSEETPEGYRAYSKLHFGVPILRNENEEFRKAYDKYIRPLSYEAKLAMMAVPLDFPVTRIMKVGQHKRYLDDIYAHFTGLGVRLTEPDEQA